MEGLTEGRVVHFMLSESDAKEINKKRAQVDYSNPRLDGTQMHVGNHVEAGEHIPMMIVKVWNKKLGYVNGKLFLDGNDDYWVTSVSPGNEPHSWHWMEKA